MFKTVERIKRIVETAGSARHGKFKDYPRNACWWTLKCEVMSFVAPAVSLNLCSFLTNPVTFVVTHLPKTVRYYSFQSLQLKTVFSTCLLDSLKHFLARSSCRPAVWNVIWRAPLTQRINKIFDDSLTALGSSVPNDNIQILTPIHLSENSCCHRHVQCYRAKCW